MKKTVFKIYSILIILNISLLPATVGAYAPIIETEDKFITNGNYEIEIKKLNQKIEYLQKEIAIIPELKEQIRFLQGEIDLQKHKVSKLLANQEKIRVDSNRIKIDNSVEIALTNHNDNFVTPAPIEIDSSANVEQKIESKLKEEELYFKSIELLEKKNYSQAIIFMERFIDDFHQSERVDNIYYWLSQLYMISGDNVKGKQNLEILIEKFPDSEKRANAMLNLASISYVKGDWQEAKDWWEKTLNQYPQTSFAKNAKINLQYLEKQGY